MLRFRIINYLRADSMFYFEILTLRFVWLAPLEVKRGRSSGSTFVWDLKLYRLKILHSTRVRIVLILRFSESQVG